VVCVASRGQRGDGDLILCIYLLPVCARMCVCECLCRGLTMPTTVGMGTCLRELHIRAQVSPANATSVLRPVYYARASVCIESSLSWSAVFCVVRVMCQFSRIVVKCVASAS